MARAVVYEPSAVQARYAGQIEEQEAAGEKVGLGGRRDLLATAKKAEERGTDTAKESEEKAVKEGKVGERDDFLTKIAKYVPAETITLVTLAFAAFSPSGTWVWVILGGGAVANVIYLFSTALTATSTPLPRWYFYLLAVLAYVLWAAAIIGPVGEKLGIKGDNLEAKQTFYLAAAAFLVPTLDTIATHLSGRLRRTTS